MAQANILSIFVQDMAATLAFYRLLGLDFPPGVEAQPHVEATAPGGFRLAFDTLEMIKGIHPDLEPPQGHRNALGFLCDSPAAVDALYAQVIAAGYASYRSPWDAFWGQRYAVVLDPDGYMVDLFAPLATAE
jgi:uncharacterized glyoxalase superfamily protein PhnB